ncbi:MAG: alpha/beta fold hydrolase [Cyanobacteria bacterium P01_A01_bin.123]
MNTRVGRFVVDAPNRPNSPLAYRFFSWVRASIPSTPRIRFWQWMQLGLGIGLLHSGLAARPAFSAENLHVSFGLIERVVSIEDLENFALTGEISEELEPYAQSLSAEQLEQIRSLLTQEADISAIAASQFLYTAQGKYILKQLGQVVQTPARLSGLLGLRASLVLAAADQEQGLTIINVLKFFPTSGVRIDLARGLAVADGLNQAVNQAEDTVALVRQTAAQEAAQQRQAAAIADMSGSQSGNQPNADAPTPPFPDLSTLPASILNNGPYGSDRTTLSLTGVDRPVDFYVPQRLAEVVATRNQPIPVILISHGLGSDRTSYAYLARYLASHGFAVASLEHSGSSAAQLNALIEGISNQLVSTNEFVRRPLFATATLDALEQYLQGQPNLRGQIDVNNVGVVGQSYGGYTALALAGTTFNLESLGRNCPPDLLRTFNLSLLLQCQIIEASEREEENSVAPELLQARIDRNSLADARIRAVLAVNPIGSVIFGPSGYGAIDVPTMVVAGTADTVAPALPEQILPFTWLTMPERYLVLINNGTHFSTIGISETGSEALPVPPEVIGPDPELAQAYLEVLSVPFFATHLLDDERYRPFLTAAFAENISQDPLPLNLVQSLAGDIPTSVEYNTVSPEAP